MFESFEEFRPKLFAIAYRMLGSASEAEDMVQETYLRVQRMPPMSTDSIQSEGAFYRKIVTRLCLDYLKTAKAQREVYPGIWLPEPIPTEQFSTSSDPAEVVTEHESLSFAFLFLLEELTPDERAVFLLREVFDYSYLEIADTVDKSESACRQLLSRAKKHMQERRPRFKASPEEHQQLLTRFMQAVQVGDLSGLTSLLAENVASYADGGGKVLAAKRALFGRDFVGRFLLGLMRLIRPGDHFEICTVNGRQALLQRDASDQLDGVVILDVSIDAIQGIYFIRNPDKLTYLTKAITPGRDGG